MFSVVKIYESYPQSESRYVDKMWTKWTKWMTLAVVADVVR